MDSNQEKTDESLLEQIWTLVLEELACSEDFSQEQLVQLAQMVNDGRMSDVNAVSAILQGKERKSA